MFALGKKGLPPIVAAQARKCKRAQKKGAEISAPFGYRSLEFKNIYFILTIIFFFFFLNYQVKIKIYLVLLALYSSLFASIDLGNWNLTLHENEHGSDSSLSYENNDVLQITSNATKGSWSYSFLEMQYVGVDRVGNLLFDFSSKYNFTEVKVCVFFNKEADSSASSTAQFNRTDGLITEVYSNKNGGEWNQDIYDEGALTPINMSISAEKNFVSVDIKSEDFHHSYDVLSEEMSYLSPTIVVSFEFSGEGDKVNSGCSISSLKTTPIPESASAALCILLAVGLSCCKRKI